MRREDPEHAPRHDANARDGALEEQAERYLDGGLDPDE